VVVVVGVDDLLLLIGFDVIDLLGLVVVVEAVLGLTLACGVLGVGSFGLLA